MTREQLERETQKEIDHRYVIENNAIMDKQFFYVALNLSGYREELERKATELINKLGYRKALQSSRG